jgi:L-amino acid N-acyltransferase YncA
MRAGPPLPTVSASRRREKRDAVTELRNGIAWISGDAQRSRSAVDTEWRDLRDGSSVVIGALAGEDEASLAAWYAERFAELRPETMYARLCGLLESVCPRVGRPADDSADHRAVLAFAPDGVVVGIARCTRAEPRAEERRSADLTVGVAGSWRDRGVASALLDRLAQSARAAGIERLTARCPTIDPALIHVLRRVGPATVSTVGTHAADIHVDLL